MKILKRALSLFIVGLFVFTAFAVIQSGGGQEQASPSAVNSFTFPYQYGTPTVPSDVGVQGKSGAGNMASLGPQTAQGPQGHLGPVNITQTGSFPTVSSTVEIHALNGTKSPASSSSAVGDTVTLENMTTGIIVSNTTNSNGYANLSVTEGWYILQINQHKNTYINFTQELDVNAASMSIVRYLMPVSNDTASVSNGGTSFATVYASIVVDWESGSLPQITNELQNLSASSGSPVLATAVTGSNGTVTFTGLNTAYTYRICSIGYSQTATGVVYDMTNQTGPNFQPTAGINHVQGGTLTAWNENTATVVGTAFPTGSSTQQIYQPTVSTTIKNGTVNIGSALALSPNVNLHFVNDLVIMNGPDSGSANPGNLTFSNSTVVFLSQSIAFSEFANISFVNTQIFGSAISSTYRSGMTVTHGFSRNSIFRYGMNQIANNPGWGGTFYDTLFEQFNSSNDINLAGVYSNQLGATFINDEFLDVHLATYSYMNISNSIVKCSLLTEAYGGGTASISNDTFVLTSNTPWVSDTAWAIQSGGTVSNTLFTYKYPANVSLSSYWADSSDIAITTSAPVKYSNDIFNFTATPHRSISLLGGNVTFNNVYIDMNYTLSQEISISKNLTPSIPTAQMFKIGVSRNFWMNDTTLDGVGNLQICPLVGNASFNHDLFTGYMIGNAYSVFSLFSSVPSGYIPHVQFGNDTFDTIYYNSTVFYNFETKLYGPIGINWLYDTNFNGQSKPIGILSFNYNTFLGMPFGPANLFVSGDLLLGANGVTTYMNNTLFANSLQATHAPVSYQNGTYYLPPYGADIAIGAGTNYITDDYFLNLSNETLPVAGSISTQGSGWAPAVHLAGNHFYYIPTPLETFVRSNGQSLPSQVTNLYHDRWLSGLPTQSTITYEIPLDINGTMTSSGFMLVSNTSLQQSNALYSSGASNGATPYVWSWGIAPDVNTQSGTPTISYSNGLVGGPQPNFIWKGYNYSESVEPTYIQVGVNSSKAPSIDLQFSGVRGIKYLVQAFSQGSEFESFVENASSSGILNATYNPATMPLDPTFEVSPYVAPPPPYNPVQPNPPMNFFPAYVFYILLATSAAGVAAGIYILIRRR